MRVGSWRGSGRGGGVGDSGRGGGPGDRGARSGGRGGCENWCTMTTCIKQEAQMTIYGSSHELTWWAEYQRAGNEASGRAKAARKQKKKKEKKKEMILHVCRQMSHMYRPLRDSLNGYMHVWPIHEFRYRCKHRPGRNFLHLPGVAAIRGREALSSIVPSTSNGACTSGAGGRSGGTSGRSGGMGARCEGTGVRSGGASGRSGGMSARCGGTGVKGGGASGRSGGMGARCGGTGVRDGGTSGRTAYLGATHPTSIAITARR